MSCSTANGFGSHTHTDTERERDRQSHNLATHTHTQKERQTATKTNTRAHTQTNKSKLPVRHSELRKHLKPRTRAEAWMPPSRVHTFHLASDSTSRAPTSWGFRDFRVWGFRVRCSGCALRVVAWGSLFEECRHMCGFGLWGLWGTGLASWA